MRRVPRSVLAGLAALTALRLVIAAWTPLGDDEAFYWEWSRHLAAGYVDHPPAIAFLVWAATHLWGTAPLAMHSVAIALSFVTSLGIWVLAREVLGDDAAATWSVILFNVIPVFSAGSLLVAPDAPLGVCWVLTLLWVWRAVERADRRSWLAAGAWLGLALDCKYTAAVLAPSVGAWLALSPIRSRWLRRPEPYRGLALAAALFAPVVWWNATHGWASFAFTFIGRPSWTDGGNLPAFLGFQLVYLAPLMFPALLWAVVVASRRGVDRWMFLSAASVPLIAGMFVASLLGHIKGHWPAPGYITATIALAGIATERPWAARSHAWRWTAVAVLGSTVLITGMIYALPVVAPPLLPPRLDPTVDYYGWPQAAQQIASVARRHTRGPFFVTSDRYQTLAQFDYATLGHYPATTITGQDQYNVWTRWQDLRGRDGLFILDGRYPPEVDLNDGCEFLEVESAIPIVRRGIVVRSLDLIWCRNFSGHPIPTLGGPRLEPTPGGPGRREVTP